MSSIQRYAVTVNDCSEVKMGKNKTGAYVKFIDYRDQTKLLVNAIQSFLSDYDSDADIVSLEPLRAALLSVGAK